MVARQSSADAIVPRLMTTVMRLTPAELREFKRQFANWQAENGDVTDEEVILIQSSKARLPGADERRLKQLITRSERDELGPDELAEYRALVSKAERVDATRVAALTQLATRWGMPVRAVMKAIGWEAGEDATTSRTARPAKTRARSRRCPL